MFLYFLSFFQNWGELPGNSGQVQEFLESLEKFAGILGGARNSMKGRWDNNCILLVNCFLWVFMEYIVWLPVTKNGVLHVQWSMHELLTEQQVNEMQ